MIFPAIAETGIRWHHWATLDFFSSPIRAIHPTVLAGLIPTSRTCGRVLFRVHRPVDF